MAGLDSIGSGGRPDLASYLAALGKSTNVDGKPTPPEAAERTSSAKNTPDVETVDPHAAVQAILAGYDLREITPREFSELTQRLHDAGAISDTDRANFTLLRRELDAEGIAPDESVDLFRFLERRLEALRQQAADQQSDDTPIGERRETAAQTATALAQYDWLVKLDTIQQLGESAMVDQRA